MRDPIFDTVVAKQTRAVDTFQHAINQVDAELRSIVSRRPELLEQAQDVQSLRDHDLQRTELAPAAQPEALTPVLDDPASDPLPVGSTPLVDPNIDLSNATITPIDETPHAPTEAEGADLGRPAEAGEITTVATADYEKLGDSVSIGMKLD